MNISLRRILFLFGLLVFTTVVNLYIPDMENPLAFLILAAQGGLPVAVGYWVVLKLHVWLDAAQWGRDRFLISILVVTLIGLWISSQLRDFILQLPG